MSTATNAMAEALVKAARADGMLLEDLIDKVEQLKPTKPTKKPTKPSLWARLTSLVKRSVRFTWAQMVRAAKALRRAAVWTLGIVMIPVLITSAMLFGLERTTRFFSRWNTLSPITEAFEEGVHDGRAEFAASAARAKSSGLG